MNKHILHLSGTDSQKRKQVKDNIIPNNESTLEKPLFTLSTFHPLTELTSMTNNESFKQLDLFYETTFPPINLNKDHSKHTLFNIISACDVMLEKITTESKKESEIDDNHIAALAALALRIKRFRIKLMTISCLHTGCIPASTMINSKLRSILKQLKSTWISFDFAVPKNSKDLKITITSTIALIVKSLINIESQLKLLLFPLASQFKIDTSCHPYNTPLIANALNEIAPNSFTGVENDFYYICRFIRMKCLPKFNAVQQKQWDSYNLELFSVFRCYGISGLTLDFHTFITKTTTINVPFSKLMALSTVSNNTFSRLITAFNAFIIAAWTELLRKSCNLFTQNLLTTSTEVPQVLEVPEAEVSDKLN